MTAPRTERAPTPTSPSGTSAGNRAGPGASLLLVPVRVLSSLSFAPLLLGCTDVGYAQGLGPIARQECDACRFVLTREVTIPSPDRSVTLGIPSPIARDSRGRIALVDRAAQGGVLVFDSTGRLIKKMSRLHGAPDEKLTHVTLAFGPGDSLHLVGSVHAVLSPALAPVRVQELPEGLYAESVVVLANGDLVVEASLRTTELIGYPLHLVSRAGMRVRSFGAATSDVHTGNVWNDRRIIGAGTKPGTVWSLPVNSYSPDLWSTEGERLGRLDPRSEWFRKWSAYDGRPHVTRPPPRASSLREDAAARLWIVTLVAAENWSPARALDSSGEPALLSVAELVKVTDTIIEVFDTRTGSRLGSLRLVGLFSSFVDGQHLAQLEQDSRGRTSVTLWKVGLTTTTQEER